MFEEKILAYLDGSLSSEEREDVLAQISGGEARATRLFNAHLRLQDLYGLAAKPTSAPLALQRELASKVPVLAMKLPYLAMPEERRKRAAGWFWELPAFRMNAILIALVALMAAGLWFAIGGGRSGPVSQTNFTKPNAISGTGSSGNAPNVSGNIPKNPAPQNGSAASAAIPSRVSSLKAAHSSNLLQRTHRPDVSHGTYATHALEPQSANPTNFAGANAPAPSSVVWQAAQPLQPIAVPQPAARFHTGHAIPIPTNSGQGNSYTPLRAFVVENIRSTRLSTQPNPSDFAKHYGVWQSALTTESPELGIDYEITPWIAAGLRAGDARFIREQQVSHLESKAGGYGHLTNEVTETALLDPFATWACAAATYTPNPGERMEYSFTAAAGDIFLGGFSPTVLGEAAATYKLGDAVAMRASLSYQASWVASANPVSAPSQTNSSEIGSSIQSVTSKLYPSQSLGFSLGVTFHP